jgi:TnpA family transposase
LGRWEQRFLGQEGFPPTLSALEIERFFTPTPAEKQVVLRRRTATNRFAFALQIGFLKMTGRLLNSVELVPPAVLAHLGQAIGCAPPRIASIRAFYRRRRTLFEHQKAARALLRRCEAPEHGLRGLTGFLRREAVGLYNGADLAAKARVWLVDHGYLLPTERELRRQAIRAMRYQQTVLFDAVCAATDNALRESWPKRLLEPAAEGMGTRLEWLWKPPTSKQATEVNEHLAKVSFLRELGAGRLAIEDLPLEGLEHFHRRVVSRKPATLLAIREPRRSLELACFLRLQLMRLTDMALDLVDRRIATQWREARKRAEEGQRGRLQRFRGLLDDLTTLASEETLSAEAMREKLRTLIAPFEPELDNTQVLAIRRALSDQTVVLGRLLKSARAVGLDLPADHKLTKAFATLDRLSAAAILPVGEENPFGRSWQKLIDQPDRAAALKSYKAATAMLLKRALNNRSVTSKDSLAHKSAEARLIPPTLWQQDRSRYFRDLSIPDNPQLYVRRMEEILQAGMARLAAAVEEGKVQIDKDGVHLPRRKRAPKDPAVERARRSLAEYYGAPQLSDMLIEVDNDVRFSWALLGRPARSAAELITLYVALLALGSDMTVAALDRMVPAVEPDMVGSMVQRLAGGTRLRLANDVVVGFMRRQGVAKLWGRGLDASADMMSLDATRHLWNARLDPRRKGPAIGTYPHVLDQWLIFYDAPIVLGKRQAGAAIEGALRQTAIERLERVAVDTHGFTHFAMAVGKFCGLDLCPRLAGIRSRKLYLPSGYSSEIPDILKQVVSQETISRKVIGRGWDSFARLSASIKGGWYPAPDALERYGWASQGDAVQATGVALGKILRSIYLCDYFANPAFRNGILDLLNQGEAVHSLQRAIHSGTIGATQGRSAEQMQAISGALTLLTNVVMAWNTHRIQSFWDKNSDGLTDKIITHLAPIAHAHINMRGIISFRLDKVATGLIEPPKAQLVPGGPQKAGF